MNQLTQSKKATILSLLVTPIFACFMLLGSAQAATQNAWRYCDKCHAMFYDGYPNKGSCAAGGGHRAQGFNFILSYNVQETNQKQGAWRYCDKCHAMFYD